MPPIRWLIWTKQDTKNEKTETESEKLITESQNVKKQKRTKNRIAKLNIETQIIWYFRETAFILFLLRRFMRYLKTVLDLF